MIKITGSRSLVLIQLLSLLIAPLVLADYSEHPKAQVLIEQLVEQHGFTRSDVKSILSLANTEQRILDSMENAAEKTKTRLHS